MAITQEGFTCGGEFCPLILALDPNRDLVIQLNKSGSSCNLESDKSTSKVDREVIARDRATRIVTKLLTPGEISKLEQSGKLTDLRIPERIDPFELKYVSDESIKLSKLEHRSSFLELCTAEEEERFKRDFTTQHKPTLHRRKYEHSYTTNEGIAVCSMCYFAYNLLNRTRSLLLRETGISLFRNENTNTFDASKSPSSVGKPLTSIEVSLKASSSNVPYCMNEVKNAAVKGTDSHPQDPVDLYAGVGITSKGFLDQGSISKTTKHSRIAALLDEFDEAKRSIQDMSHELVSDHICDVKAPEHQDSSHDQKKTNVRHDRMIMDTRPRNFEKKDFAHECCFDPKRRESVRKRQRQRVIKSSEMCEVSSKYEIMTGTVTYDVSTSFPFAIIDNRVARNLETSSQSLQYAINLIVCNDIFDTYERFIAPLIPFVVRYPNTQILLWNYPGQCMTTFSEKYTLDNHFFSECLSKLLNQIGVEGSRKFDTERSFYLMGSGCGGSVAVMFAAKYNTPSLRALLLINPLTFVDTYFASVIHDCRNAFKCSPEERVDIPTYFLSRFLFSSEYLQKVSAKVALDLYTSIKNPITLKGRLQLCHGVLNFSDVRDQLSIVCRPIVAIHGKDSCFVRSFHSASLREGRTCLKSIYQALCWNSYSAVVIMTEGGHELIQEKTKYIFSFLEKLFSTSICSGNSMHPLNEDNFDESETVARSRSPKEFEIVRDYTLVHAELNRPVIGRVDPSSANQQSLVYESETHHHCKNATVHVKRRLKQKSVSSDAKLVSSTVLDPQNPAFERHENKIYRPGNSLIYPDPKLHPNVKECMHWRLKRNKKRFCRLHKAAAVIQNRFRLYKARSILRNLKKESAALLIQKMLRGIIGRRQYQVMRKKLWAARFVQRAYRGHLGRLQSYGRRMAIASQLRIARRWRSLRCRRTVKTLIQLRTRAATVCQCFWRKSQSKFLLKKLLVRKKASIFIQKRMRGIIGRRRASLERDKFIFSRSQSDGIELGRRLLSEHKLKATRLQSELNIIEQEQLSIKSKINVLNDEMASFEETVHNLEKEMHKLTTFERDFPAKAQGTARHELREKKIRLNQEFSFVLTRVSDRKSQLKVLDERLTSLESERQKKTGELNDLERKLVFLLENQEHALEEIRIRQEKKGEIVSTNNIEGFKKIIEPAELTRGAASDKDKLQASQLMESTETMMKFGFMSMSMTYFSSLNMIRAMKSVAEKDAVAATNNNAGDKSVQDSSKVVAQTTCRKIGQQIDVNLWNVDHVVKWLESIHLSQYESAFREGSIDGPFLCQLTDDDLRFVLGVEHKLHRKKILYNISKLVKPVSSLSSSIGKHMENDEKASEPTNMSWSRKDELSSHKNLLQLPSLHELSLWIQNHKFQSIQEALQNVPLNRFDKCCLRVQFVEGIGTAYVEPYERESHLNKVDAHGNTALHIAAQNGDLRIAKYLIERGANPNHQNKQGQTPGHFAVAYQFFDFASWLFDERGGSANDLLANVYGLGPYDGLMLGGDDDTTQVLVELKNVRA